MGGVAQKGVALGKQRIKPNYRRRVLRLPDLWDLEHYLTDGSYRLVKVELAGARVYPLTTRRGIDALSGK